MRGRPRGHAARVADIAALVTDLGGMAQKQQLVRRGATDFDLTMAVRRNEVVRVRNGWYTTLDPADPRVLAVRVGGRLTGLSAIAHRGGWVRDPGELQVSVPINAARLRTPRNRWKRLNVLDKRGVRLHWDSPDVGERGDSTRVGLLDALVRVALDAEWEDAVAAVDWALHTGLIDEFDVQSIAQQLPSSRRKLADWVDPNCESLPESLARTRLRAAGHRVTSQHVIVGGQRVDLRVDDAIGLEVDGDEFHRHRFEQDRSKDLDITIEHMHALRPAANHVFHDWPRVHLAIRTALHERGIRPSGNSGLVAPRRAHSHRTRARSATTPEFPYTPREYDARRGELHTE